jgi:WD40 repeat protein
MCALNFNSVCQRLIFLSLLPLLFSCDMTERPEKTVAIAENGIFSASLTDHYALLGTTAGFGELWEIDGKPSLIHQWKHTDNSEGIIANAMTPDQKYAVTAEYDSIAWWRIADGRLLAVWSLPGIHSVSISPDGQFALVGLADQAIYLALKYGKTLYAFPHDDIVSATALSESGQYALTGSHDHSAKLWNLSDGTLHHHWTHNNRILTVAISPDDRYALTNGALDQTKLWSILTGKLHSTLGPLHISLTAVRFSHDSRLLLLGHTTQRIELWNTNTADLVKYWRPKKDTEWRPSAATLMAFEFTQDNKSFYSLTSHGFLQKWRI